MNDTANQNKEFEELEVDFDAMEGYLSSQLEASFSDLNLLEEDREKIANPDSLGATILDEVWKQFGNQIGLDITNETLIQQYDRMHPESYDKVGKAIHAKAAKGPNDEESKILYTKECGDKYNNTKDKMKTDQINGTLTDTYTGKPLKPGEDFDVEHVESAKELFDNQRRKQANLSTGELANKDENLVATNKNLNRSKKEKSVNKYVDTREQREADLIKQNERANKKVDESDISHVEKRLQKEKNDKALQNKLDADTDLMKQADKTARKAINKDIATGAIKETGKKAGKDALKMVVTSLLFGLLKEIINGFVRFLKSQAKTFGNFLAEMREALRSFFAKIISVVQPGVSVFVGTIVSEIFGPIVSVFKKLASFIKQGISSFIDTINYLKDKSSRNKPFSVKAAQVGKIVTAGLTVGSAIVSGEVFEKLLLPVPGMQIPLPLLGTLANLIGLFLGSLVSGIVGAIVLNLIDKFIAKKLKAENTKAVIEKQNEVKDAQEVLKYIGDKKVETVKKNAVDEMMERHSQVDSYMKKRLKEISEITKQNSKDTGNLIVVTENSEALLKLQEDLKSLL